MALQSTWTDPVELNTNDVLTATTMNEQVYQNLMYLREPPLLQIATMGDDQSIQNYGEWANITDLVVNVVCPIGKALVTVNIPYLYGEDINPSRYIRFALFLNNTTRKIIHINSAREVSGGRRGTVSSTVFLSGLETDTATTFQVQVYNNTATDSSNSRSVTIYGGSGYISQLAVQAIG